MAESVRGDMIDWARVDELRAEIGDDGFEEVVELFLDEVEEVLARLRTHPDPARYEEDLHFLKGSAWNIGFRQMGLLCQSGEARAANGHQSEVVINDVLDIYTASKRAFLAGRQEPGSNATAA